MAIRETKVTLKNFEEHEIEEVKDNIYRKA